MTGFLLFVGAVLLAMAAGLSFAAWSYVNAVRYHRAGIYRVTALQAAGIAWVLLLLFAGLAFLVWNLIQIGISDSLTSFESMAYVVGAGFVACALGFAMIFAMARQQATAQRARNEQTTALFQRIRARQPLERPLFVYLRPFSAAKAGTPTEQLVVELLERRGTLCCVGESDFHVGMGRIVLRDDEWQSAVLDLCERAAAIVIYPAASHGTLWELSQLTARGWLDRTLFFMPPNILIAHALSPLARFADSRQRAQLEAHDLRSSWERARSRSREFGVELPAYRDEGGLFRLAAGQVEWVTLFARAHLYGKTPTVERETLEPILDALTAERPP
jgi:hypothetical protein